MVCEAMAGAPAKQMVDFYTGKFPFCSLSQYFPSSAVNRRMDPLYLLARTGQNGRVRPVFQRGAAIHYHRPMK
jgi:hypothetical protein